MRIPKNIRRLMVYQNLSNDCGFACLKMICNHYGYPFDMDRAKEKYWNANGLNLLDFKALAATHDFKTSAFAITHAENLAMKSPFILVKVRIKSTMRWCVLAIVLQQKN